MLLVVLAACAPPEPEPLLRPDEPLPLVLSELGYADHPEVHAFEPDWPLWSNGLTKERWVYLPQESIEHDGQGAFTYPYGALFLKTFSVDGQPVETRAMRQLGWAWEYAVWLWDGDDAVQLDLLEAVPVDVADHAVPSRFQCRMCHERNGVLGFTPRQVDMKPYRELFTTKPAYRPVEADGSASVELLGGFVGNCVHCHDGRAGGNQSYSLEPEDAVSNLVGVETDPTVSAPGVRVVPGVPEESVLYLAISGDHADPELRDMPPLGVQTRDQVFIDEIYAWIKAL